MGNSLRFFLLSRRLPKVFKFLRQEKDFIPNPRQLLAKPFYWTAWGWKCKSVSDCLRHLSTIFKTKCFYTSFFLSLTTSALFYSPPPLYVFFFCISLSIDDTLFSTSSSSRPDFLSLYLCSIPYLSFYLFFSYFFSYLNCIVYTNLSLFSFSRISFSHFHLPVPLFLVILILSSFTRFFSISLFFFSCSQSFVPSRRDCQ